MKHPYKAECQCQRCQREGARRQRQSESAYAIRGRSNETSPWATQRAQARREWQDAFDSGRPMSSDDY